MSAYVQTRNTANFSSTSGGNQTKNSVDDLIINDHKEFFGFHKQYQSTPGNKKMNLYYVIYI